MQRVDFSCTKLNDGFWKRKQDLIRDVSVYAVYDRFKETGRFDAFKCDKSSPIKPHIFWDSDVAKWIEGVAYLTSEKKESALEAIADEVIDNIEKNMSEDGYFNSYFTTLEPENIFKWRDCHELYCLGHLIEAGVAYFEATGKDKLLKLTQRYVDYVIKVFVEEKSAAFSTPGHEEIELALVRLFECTGDEKYLRLSAHFIDSKGKEAENLTDWSELKYCQSHLPVREQETAEGHAVRAVYLYCAMADLALKYNDGDLRCACEKIFDDIATKKLYITGGIGSSSAGEAFTVPYDLPNLIAYTESCAALGLALFAHRMLLIDNNSKYSDIIERAIYNGFLSSISLDGKSFFYTNPLQIIPYMHKRDVSVSTTALNLPMMLRKEVFDCSCCPPNIVRFIPSIANFLYTCDDSTLYIHQFMQSESEVLIGDKKIKVEQKTNYPYDGKIEIKISGAPCRVAVRIPSWFDGYEGKTEKGYAYFNLKNGETLSLDFDMKPFFIGANPKVALDCGKYAIQKGPIVYCMEGVDNGEGICDIHLDSNAEFFDGFDNALGVPTLTIDAYRRKEINSLYYKKNDDFIDFYKTSATLIPYFAFANRGETEMQVWHFVK